MPLPLPFAFPLLMPLQKPLPSISKKHHSHMTHTQPHTYTQRYTHMPSLFKIHPVHLIYMDVKWVNVNGITYMFFHHLSITAINPPSYTTAKTSSSIATSAKSSSRIACFVITPCSGRGCYGAQVPNLLFLHCESSFSQPL